jgi:hypothetical protein
MLLTADRLDVIENERIRAVLLVGAPMVSVLTLGGVDHLRRELEDVGFRDVQVFLDRPETWRFGASVARPSGLEWLLFADLVPAQTASLQRQLTEELRVLDSWDARLDGEPAVPAFHPYAVDLCATARFAGVVRVHAMAYPLEAF